MYALTGGEEGGGGRAVYALTGGGQGGVGGESFCLCVSLTSGLLPLLRSVQVWRRGPTESRDVVVEWSQWL